MRVVEQEGEAGAMLAQIAHRGDQIVVVPFVNDHEVGAVGQSLDRRAGGVGARGELRIARAPECQPFIAMIGEKVSEAPRALGFVGDNVVAPIDQLAQHAAQKMRVAVVPAGGDAVGEIDDSHAAAL